ncbi:MAG: IS110 family transposase [Chloroflexales bacterium]|nr:IS110 family transposase [Chloroflexales bacterium]
MDAAIYARQKIDRLTEALEGRVRDHHRFLLARYLEQLDFLDTQIARFDAEIERALMVLAPAALSEADPGASSGTAREPLTASRALELLDSAPGINARLAEVLIAEIGLDMSRFPSAKHLASWAGVAPGNNESAGKQRSGRTRPGNPALRKALAQAAHGAARQKDSYFQALYLRLAGRRGRNRALVAVAHALVVAIYHMLARQEPYRDPGGNYFDERKRESVVNRLVHRLEKLGYSVEVALQPAQPAGAT